MSDRTPPPVPTESSSSSGRRFAANTFWMVLTNVGSKLASFVFVVIVARGLGPTAYGYFNFAVSFMLIFLMFGTWGQDVAIVREIARDRSRLSELFASGLYLRLGLGVFAYLAALAIVPLLVDGRDALTTAVVIGLALLVDEISSYVGAVFKAFERMALHTLVTLANRVLSTALALVALVLGADLLTVCFVYLSGSIGALIAGITILRKRFPPIHMRDARRDTSRMLFWEGAPLGLAGFLNMIVFRLDTVFLQAMKGAVAVAYYGIAYRFFESFLFVAWALGNVALPMISRSGRGKEAGDTFLRGVTVSLLFYLPLAIGAPFAARDVIVTLFGDRYADAAGAVSWLSAAGVFYSIGHVARLSSIALGRRKAILGVAALMVLVNVGLNVALIPRYSYEGAAAATCLTVALEAVILTSVFARANGSLPLGRIASVPVLSGVVMAAVLLASDVTGWAAVVVGAAGYGIAVAILGRALAPSETKTVIAMVRRPAGAKAS